MNISLHWLREYLELPEPLSDQAIADKLTAIGLEVEGMHPWTSVEGGLEGLVIGHVLSAEAHPNADKLRLTRVDVGSHSDEPLPIVCGAPNVAAGQKVVVALEGSTLYPAGGDPFTIKKAKIRGEVSRGMICAEDEIGLGSSHDGIMVLPEDTPVGTAAAEVFGVTNDTILEIGLTPNRADANSHLGVARDLVAALVADGMAARLEAPTIPAMPAVDKPPFPVRVEEPAACNRYAGVLLDNIKVGPSPAWMREHLEAIGVKSINNVVDTTNYVLHALGQPLHAFDADAVKGGIVVRTLPANTVFTTLDETERRLRADDLMICDEEKALCIAGVYGGQGSGVSNHTRRLFLESARFDPLWIRRTASHHGLRTDAAGRFEKGTDPNLPGKALALAVSLLMEHAGAQVAAAPSDWYPEPVERASIRLRWAQLDRLLGQTLPREEVKAILEALDIAFEADGEQALLCRVPTDKTDVTREADLVEEILRIYGMDRIALPPFLRSNIAFGAATARESLRNRIADYLVGAGFREIFTNPITKSRYLTDHWPTMALPDESSGRNGQGDKHPASAEGETKNTAPHAAALANSLNADLDVMRPSLVFGGLEVVAYNANRKRGDQFLFEFGRVFSMASSGSKDAFEEAEHLGLWMHGRAEPESWRDGRDEADYTDAKRVVMGLLERCGLEPSKAVSAELPWMAYGETLYVGAKKAVTFGRLSAKLEEAFTLRQAVFYASVNWDLIMRMDKKRKTVYQAVSRVPAMRRDLALVLPKATNFADVEATVRQYGGKLLREIRLFDVYEGESLGSGKKSYGLGLSFRDDRATLTDKQVDRIMKKVIQQCETDLQAVVRR